MLDLIQTGVDCWNRGLYWDAHEAWEEVWRETFDQGDRDLYQGLIQCAAALHNHGRGSAAGARTVFARARSHLDPLGDRAGHFPVAAIVDSVAAVLAGTRDRPVHLVREGGAYFARD